MANIKSAIKRIDTAKRNNLRNRTAKAQIKTLIKNFETALDNDDLDKAKSYLSATEKKLQQAAAKNIIHKNNAARKIGQLTRKINQKAAN